jgi:hypothetical protein
MQILSDFFEKSKIYNDNTFFLMYFEKLTEKKIITPHISALF